MGEWGDTTFDRSSDAWGSVNAGFEGQGVGESGGTQRVELFGTELRVAGTIDLNRFHRVADYVNIVDGYIVLGDAVIQDRSGEPTSLTMRELRMVHHDVAIVGLSDADPGIPGETGERRPHRLAVFTRSHIVEGDVIVHGDVSIMAMLEATDPRFIPMSSVVVRWLRDRALAARYPSALLQRTHLLGVATEGMMTGAADAPARPTPRVETPAPTTQESDRSAAPSPSAAWPAADALAPRGLGQG